MSDTPLFARLADYLKQDRPLVTAVVIRGPQPLLGQRALIPADSPPQGPLLDVAWAEEIVRDARHLLDVGQPATRRYQAGAVELFFEVHLPAPRLVIVGAVHIAGPLIHYATPLGFKTILVDPRTAFATPERFPHADVIQHHWPDEALPEIGLTEQTAVAVITHDPKLDDPALKLALASPAFYVGALGSPKTHARRVARLLAEGVSEEQLARLHAPIGLNIGGRSPAEIALSVMAEIVAVQNRSELAGGADREKR